MLLAFSDDDNVSSMYLCVSCTFCASNMRNEPEKRNKLIYFFIYFSIEDYMGETSSEKMISIRRHLTVQLKRCRAVPTEVLCILVFHNPSINM